MSPERRKCIVGYAQETRPIHSARAGDEGKDRFGHRGFYRRLARSWQATAAAVLDTRAMTRGDTPILLITGPTSSGKSRLAIAVAEEFRGSVINADSMQIYRDLAVLTARPGAAELARVPHRLFGVLDAAELCSAARWLALGVRQVSALRESRSNSLALQLGGAAGTLAALGDRGLRVAAGDAEQAADSFARAIDKETHRVVVGKSGQIAMTQRRRGQRRHVPDGLPGDSQRLVRAYEVVAGTGRSLMEWQQAQIRTTRPGVAAVVLLPPRETLYAAIDARFARMATAGALEEVRMVLARKLSSDLPALKAVGLRELARHVRGETSLEAAIGEAQQASRRYAKRQMTWLRTQLPPPNGLPTHLAYAQYSESLLPEIFSFIRQFLLTASPQAV